MSLGYSNLRPDVQFLRGNMARAVYGSRHREFEVEATATILVFADGEMVESGRERTRPGTLADEFDATY